MKKAIMILLILIPLLVACEDENEMDNAIITGIDARECSCCGGFFIDIRDSTFRFQSLPPGSSLDLYNNPKFPIYVKVDWKMRDTLCLGDEITVLKIIRQ